MLTKVRRAIYKQSISTKRQKILKSTKQITELENVITGMKTTIEAFNSRLA